MIDRLIPLLALCTVLFGCATAAPDAEAARQAVVATERAFAKTMADRNHAVFASFIADEAVFFSGPKPLHGKQQVVDFWARFYAKPAAPFSWEPDEVEVLASGNLALSSGPVRNPEGKLIARFTSIWRRTVAGTWEIIFDKGNDVCDCKTP
ncbi:MAG: DUF4440 domain-containing protein [Burkholderiales bacterium PBB3]|nr:MAG: DUF4440 domain-containing protein [Burkholderiales bacterium PBB3]